jgi:hypothetical protein
MKFNHNYCWVIFTLCILNEENACETPVASDTEALDLAGETRYSTKTCTTFH